MSEVVGPDGPGIARAAAALKAGRLVVFPTETVYGLGADALRPDAIARIFEAKGRPQDNPLIVHVHDVGAARALCKGWTEEAGLLATAFWPGPLTMVLPRGEDVPDATTAGLDSIALRVPAHPIARELLERAGLAVAAPSANRSGRPSPTRVQDARADLGDAVDVYVDGGPAFLGLESTVISLIGAPVVLRQGGIPIEWLREVLPEVTLATQAQELARSPGTRHRHYAPQAHVHLVSAEDVEPRARELQAQGRKVAIIASSESGIAGARVPGGRAEAGLWAQALFALLRDLDAEGAQDVVVEQIPEEGLGAAVMDRLRRAAKR